MFSFKGVFISYHFCPCACSKPNFQISSVLLNSAELKIPSLLSPDRLAELSHLLPSLGVTFLQGVTPSQLLSALPALSSVPFSPAQVGEHTQPVM